jgi:hypothetical protein
MTIPISGGRDMIANKRYANGFKVEEVNTPLIYGFARMFGINTDKIVLDHETFEVGTSRIIDYCRKFGCSQYLTNPEAEEKYLDVKAVEASGITIIPFSVTNDYKIGLFEALEKWGVEGTRKMICKQ